MWAFKNERQKCSVVFANDHIIIQVLTCTWDRWQYGRLIAVSHRHEIRACKWLDQNWRKNYKGWGKISFQFFLCVYARSASENHTFSNMPGRIASASQTSSRTSPPPARALRSVTHCAAPLHHGKSPAGRGVGCMSHLVMQACVRTWVDK